MQNARPSTRNNTSLYLNGAGCSFSFGGIYRPTGWLRIGFGLQTPSLGSLRTRSYGTLVALTDSVRTSRAPDLNYLDRSFHTPLHTSTSVAFQIGAYAMIGLQYDNYHAKYQDDMHSLRVGFEVIPILGMYINGGYAYESTFKTPLPTALDKYFERQDTYSTAPLQAHYISAGLGYRGTHVIVQAAYQYHWQRAYFWEHENVDPWDLKSTTHRVVLTIGWHRN